MVFFASMNMFIEYICGFTRFAGRTMNVSSFPQIVGLPNFRKSITAIANQKVYNKFAIARDMTGNFPNCPIRYWELRTLNQVLLVNFAPIVRTWENAIRFHWRGTDVTAEFC